MNRVHRRTLRVRPAGLVVALLFIAVVVPARAQDSAPQTDDAPASETSGGATGLFEREPDVPADAGPVDDLTSAAVKTFVALLVVLALVLGLAYLLKRTSAHMRQMGGGGISVLAQIPLGSSQFLSVVDIGGEVLVLGVTEHSVTALSEIEDADLIARLREDRSGRGRAAQTLQGIPSFRQWLQRAQHGDVD